MDWSIYLQTRRFRQPYRERLQSVGWGCMIWAALSGPLYFWKKGAQIEALLLALVCVPPIFASATSSAIDPETLAQMASLAWGGSALLAPVLLAACYRRRGWDEVLQR